MTSGIFIALSSFSAISNGSVSLSKGTRTGAFMLSGGSTLPMSLDDGPSMPDGWVCHVWMTLVKGRESILPHAFARDGNLPLPSPALVWFPHNRNLACRRDKRRRGSTYLICRALVPNTRALSYFVI